MESTLEVRHLTERVGAEISGVDLARLSDEDFATIRATFETRHGLLFRGLDLTDDGLVAFSRRFGALDHAPLMETGRTAVDGYPEIYIVSNVKDDQGRAIGSLGSGEAVWHTDMSYLENPPYASALYALEIPPNGGATSLCGMAAAYQALPEPIQARLKELRIKHDGTYNSGGYVRQGVSEADNPVDAVGTFHPSVLSHPATGEPMLYLGRRRNAYIEGLSLADSESLLDEIWSYAALPENTYVHEWRIGDLLMWDNRATMHRRDPFDASERRLLKRTQMQSITAPDGSN